jgi:hypothetical protein
VILVGWVEVRNPTLQIGLNPTYQKPDFSFSNKLSISGAIKGPSIAACGATWDGATHAFFRNVTFNS